MITLFNRKELAITSDIKRQNEIRDILAANDIDYIVKVKNLLGTEIVGTRRTNFGSFGINQDYSYEYKIYVLKDDYERAANLI